MRYSYKYKKRCVKMYREGRWIETPEGIKSENFHNMIRRWAQTEALNGSQVLKHTGTTKKWTPEEKFELVSKVLAGRANQAVATEAGINSGMLYTWVRKYREEGYNGLINKPKGRPPRKEQMKRKEPAPLTEAEREELIRLRAEIAARKRKSSGNSGKRVQTERSAESDGNGAIHLLL